MKILFMGTPSYAETILKTLISKYDVIGVYTQPDKPVGRKKILTAPPVKKVAIENSIEVFQPDNLKNEAEHIKKLNPDFIVVAAFGMLLPKDILDIAPCINLHASILPKYRGASPIQSAILNGDKFTGVTSMKMDIGMDTGDILDMQYVEIEDKTAPILFDELSNIASELILHTIDNYSNIKPLKQNSSDATHCKKIRKSDGKIEFNNALTVFRKYRAFIEWPNIFIDNLKLKNIELNSCDGSHRAGEILEINRDFIVVGCLKGSLKIYSVQPNSKKEMKSFDYVNGKRLKVGDILS